MLVVGYLATNSLVLSAFSSPRVMLSWWWLVGFLWVSVLPSYLFQ